MNKVEILDRLVKKYLGLANKYMFERNRKMEEKYDRLAIRCLEEMFKLKRKEFYGTTK